MSTRHWTEAYLGLPYAQGGSGPEGYNCWGFFRFVQRDRFGIHVPEISEPESLPKLLRKVPAAAAELGWEKIAVPRTGDAVLMAHHTHPSHCGVYVDDIAGGAILHCIAGPGSVLHSMRHLEIASWRIAAFYRPVATTLARLEVSGHG